MTRRIEIGVDCIDEAPVKAFWAAALGYVEVPVGDGTELHDPDGVGPVMWFQHTDEPKSAKNRLHLDLWLRRDEAEPLQARLLDLGGAILRERGTYTVLTDPEGNEVCLCWGSDGSGVPG